jgi:general secretion pathway protein G
MPLLRPNRPHSLRKRAFTLVEIMVVVVIIGLLASMAAAALRKIKRSAQTSRYLNDLRIFSGAFEKYALENGGWPADVSRSTVPAGMAGEFNATIWMGTTPLGGQWDYDAGVFGVIAGISVVGPTVDISQMQEIDAKIDDGNLATGNFRQVGTRFIWILDQ